LTYVCRTCQTGQIYPNLIMNVTICHGENPYSNAYKALESISFPDLKDKKVLLKPNAGRKVKPGKGITTEPEVVAAACDFFEELGCYVSVGESPILGVTALECLEESGIAEVVRLRGIPLIDLDELPATKTEIKDGEVLKFLAVCGAVKEFDYIVSIPVLKTHMHCDVSLSLKNMKGCLRGREKVRLHQLPPPKEKTEEKTLNIAIADLSTILKPDLALIDGTVGMEGLGPSAGTQKKMSLVLSSTDYLSADAVAAALMGFDPIAIPHLRLAAERAGRKLNLDEINISPSNWKDLVNSFERSPKEISIEFPDVEILDKESCSACQSTLLLFLKRYYNEIGDYLPAKFAIGKGHEPLEDGVFCIGNCTIKSKGGNLVVKGCPPVASDILNFITKK